MHAQEVQQTMTLLTTQLVQLQRTVWLMAREAGGAMVIDEASMDPLWDLKYERVKGNPTLLKVEAAMLPEPTPEQITKLADRLRGTSKPPGDEMMNVGLVDYPFAYVVGRLSPLIVIHQGQWITRIQYEELPDSEKIAPQQQ